MAKRAFIKYITVGLTLLLGSCTCNKPYAMRSIQDDDKQLNCKAVVLSINEAEQYRKKALETRGITTDQALLPLCWAPTYLAAQDAVAAADERLEYLGNIYDLLNCGKKGKPPPKTLPPPPPYRPGALPPMQRRPLPPPPGYSPRR